MVGTGFNKISYKSGIDQFILFFILLCVCLLEPTKNISFKGLLLCSIYLLWSQPVLRNQWFKLIWPWFLVVLLYFIAMSFYAFSASAAMHDGGEVLKGVSVSFLALYLCTQSEENVKSALKWASIVLVLLTVSLVLFNFYVEGFYNIFEQDGFEWIVNRNRLAVGFSIVFLYIIPLMFNEMKISKIWFWQLCLLIIGIAAFLNNSRGAIMGVIIAALVVVVFQIQEYGSKRIFRFNLLILPFMFTFCFLAYCFFYGVSFLHHDSLDNGRLEIWQAVSERIIHSPWIGYGPHAMPYDPILKGLNLPSYVFPHNIYLGLIYESGLFGLLFWGVWFFTLHRRVKNLFITTNKTMFLVVVGLLVNILVHGLVDLEFYSTSVITYLVVGLVILSSKVLTTKV